MRHGRHFRFGLMWVRVVWVVAEICSITRNVRIKILNVFRNSEYPAEYRIFRIRVSLDSHSDDNCVRS